MSTEIAIKMISVDDDLPDFDVPVIIITNLEKIGVYKRINREPEKADGWDWMNEYHEGDCFYPDSKFEKIIHWGKFPSKKIKELIKNVD